MSNDKTRAAVEKRLSDAGWLEQVAGEDYAKGVDAAVKAFASPRLGVIVSGQYGCGKTHYIRAVAGAVRIRDMNLPEEVKYLDWNLYPEEVERWIRDADTVIDDLGAEPVVNEYGVKRDIVVEYVCRLHAKGRGRLFITTNLGGEELAARYGGRFVSRLKDLCVPVRFTGNDKRRWTL